MITPDWWSGLIHFWSAYDAIMIELINLHQSNTLDIIGIVIDGGLC